MIPAGALPDDPTASFAADDTSLRNTDAARRRGRVPQAPAPLTPLYTVAQVRAVEAECMAALPQHALMQRAAQAATLLALALARHGESNPARILVAAGPGNNGGDALECAALLADHGCCVTVLLPGSVSAAAGASRTDGPILAASDHAQALARVEGWRQALSPAADRQGSIALLYGTAMIDTLARHRWDLAIDGLFGIGLRPDRPLMAPWRDVIAMLNAVAAPLLALDVPSGLDADTGMLLADPTAPDAACIRASHTITFIGDKPGLHTGSGREMAGIVTLASLDLPATVFPPPLAWCNGPSAFADVYSGRRQDAHKGSFGDVAVIGGGTGMAGAAILAAQAALKSGCGRVMIGFAQGNAQDNTPAFIPGQPELMCRSARDLIASGAASKAVHVVGPGLGQAPQTVALIEQACDSAAALVLDADALNLIAVSDSLQARVAARTGATILTPHPLEAARLLGIGVAAVQADRLQAARALAARYRAVVILKGSGTVIVAGEQLLINPTGNPALATGGTGDVLAGMCGALLAQGWAPAAAAAGAVWLHGAAADWLVARGIGPVGVTAGEIIDAARTVRNRLASA